MKSSTSLMNNQTTIFNFREPNEGTQFMCTQSVNFFTSYSEPNKS